MNNEKSQNQALSDATSEQKKVTGVNVREHKDALYTWEITLVHKKQIARKGFKFLLLTINLPMKTESGKNIRSFQSFKQVDIEKLQDQETFEYICAIGFNQMKQQLIEKGFIFPS